MKTYLVGGAVRDKLLNLPIKDRDWVVVGATPAKMLAQGFQQVGKDFPVFLHPNNHEEYALARTERKQGSGYTGFVCHSGLDVTLEDDLKRRDLTINAIAEDDQGNLFDPFNGQTDLDDRVLRHVSEAFSEDPLRVLRVARFLARYAHLGFRIADETLDLMRNITETGELEHLTPERVWQETERALLEHSPLSYFTALRECNALSILFPELNALFGVPQTERYHPEIDTGIHTFMALEKAIELSKALAPDDALAVRFAVLLHDLGKGLTPAFELPAHHGHEALSEHLAKRICIQYKVPNPVKRLTLLVAKLHTHCHKAFELKPATVMRLFESLDVIRRPETLDLFLIACEADARGRKNLEDSPYPQADYLKDAYEELSKVEPKALINLGFRGEALGQELRKKRIDAIRAVKNNYVTT